MSVPVDGAVGEVEGCGAVGGDTGEDGFAVEGVWDDAAADGEVEIVVGAVGGTGGLQVEELVGWSGDSRGGQESDGGEELHDCGG